jgi:uncharacterized protein YabE (DUF348 family)
MKIIIALLLAIVIAFPVYAKTLKCIVVGVDGAILPESTHNQVILECDDIDGLNLGDKVKIKLPKKETAIEGC